MSAPPPFLWSVGGASVPGASHRRRGVPNQDAIAAWPADGAGPVAVLVLSDGHGSPAHSRSDVGARLAVETARPILIDALSGPAPLDPGALGRAILSAWRARVLEHFAGHPRREGEAAGEPLHLYGATLVAAGLGPNGGVLLQLGDGDLLARMADGTILRPLPVDADLVGEQTYSLCLAGAEGFLRGALIPDPGAVDFLMLSTDGLSKSFADDADFLRLAGTWGDALAALGLPGVVAALPEWLEAASGRGSGDDMTLGFVLRAGAGAARGAGTARARAPTPSRAARWLRAAFDRLKAARRPRASDPRSACRDLP